MSPMIKLQMSNDLRQTFQQLFEAPPQAYAFLQGSPAYPDLWGEALMYPCWGGTLFFAEVQGLPQNPGPCKRDIYGFHIHTNPSCSGTPDHPFANVGPHWDLDHCPHPAHTGDLPPLFASCGYALTLFYTRRFLPEETVGHTLIIHSTVDDFTTQPSGAPGEMIACGQILANESI